MRRYLAGIFITTLVLLLAVAAQAQADSAQAARAALSGTMNQVLSILSSSEFKNTENRKPHLDHIERLVRQIFDYQEFSARTVGMGWRSFSPEQKSRFSNAFADLLRATYLERIKSYDGDGIVYLGERMSSKGDKVEVRTQIDLDGKAIPVDYRMLNEGRWMVYDIIVEGVSLVKNYRTQFSEILLRENAEGLIKRVEEQAEKVRKENEEKPS